MSRVAQAGMPYFTIQLLGAQQQLHATTGRRAPDEPPTHAALRQQRDGQPAATWNVTAAASSTWK